MNYLKIDRLLPSVVALVARNPSLLPVFQSLFGQWFGAETFAAHTVLMVQDAHDSVHVLSINPEGYLCSSAYYAMRDEFSGTFYRDSQQLLSHCNYWNRVKAAGWDDDVARLLTELAGEA